METSRVIVLDIIILKPIDYDALFKSKQLIAALTEILVSREFQKKTDNYSTTTSTSVKDKPYEDSGRTKALNENLRKEIQFR